MFSDDEKPNPRLFQIVDQMSDQAKIKQAKLEANKKGLEISKESEIKEFLKQYKCHQIDACKKLAILQKFDFPSLEQMVDDHTTLLNFLMRQQNQTMMTDRPALLDFKAPLEFELRFLDERQM